MLPSDLIEIDPNLLAKWNRPVPRYTSYPTAPQFHRLEESVYEDHLARVSGKPLSLYVHIPFCRSMCLFCGCSVILNRNSERQKNYLDCLIQEIALVAARLGKRGQAAQLHLGGGTPTSLSVEEFEQLMAALHSSFQFEGGAEISIEIDPRTVYLDKGEKLKALKRLGFNRVSFGVQDLDARVQEAVKRRQSEEMSKTTFDLARELEFDGINLDLIYGLPLQDVESFSRTVETIASWRPDRIAMYSYANVPWMKAHQRAIPPETLPSVEEKFRIYVEARSLFMRRGYTALGMDHFALDEDSISAGYREGKLQRNFQGYSLRLAEHMIGLGVSSIGFVEDGYFQNIKDLPLYTAKISEGKLPIERGIVLSLEDIRRRWTIQTLMCKFELDKREFEQIFALPFDEQFLSARPALQNLVEDGLLEEHSDHLRATPIGRLMIRLIASAFDAYLDRSGKFSGSI